jgi:hypothetical protein
LEQRDEARFEKLHREYEEQFLDEIQVYRNVQAVEQRRWKEGKAPKVRFLTDEEQRAYQGMFPKPLSNVVDRPSHGSEGSHG